MNDNDIIKKEHNLFKCNGITKYICENNIFFIAHLFSWSSTKEGYNFWLEEQLKLCYADYAMLKDREQIERCFNRYLSFDRYVINDSSIILKMKYHKLKKEAKTIKTHSE